MLEEFVVYMVWRASSVRRRKESRKTQRAALKRFALQKPYSGVVLLVVADQRDRNREQTILYEIYIQFISININQSINRCTNQWVRGLALQEAHCID